MLKRDFDGQVVSVLGLGCANFGGRFPESQAEEFMDCYTEMGGNFLDTARVYGTFRGDEVGESERVIGHWLEKRHNRERIFLSTKGAHPRLSSMNVSRLSRADIRADMEGSLEALRTNYVDIYWLHRDEASRPVGDIMETMQSLIEDGQARRIGTSNWHPKRIEEANEYARTHGLTPFCANQPQFSLAQPQTLGDPTLRLMDAEAYALHCQTNLICAPFSSQAGGFFTKLDTLGADNLSQGTRKQYLTRENLDIYARMKEVSKQTGLSIGAIALAYLTAQPFPVFPLVGISSMAQLDALKEAADAQITAEQRDMLRRF